MNIVYYSEGMKHFGENMVKYMGFKRYDPKTDINKKVFFQGLYHEQDYQTFANHMGERVLYWNGSDVLRTLMQGTWLWLIQHTPAEHLCHSYWQQEVLRRVGVKVKIFPIFFGDLRRYQVHYEQSDTPQVFLTSHNGRDEDYGVDIVERIAPKVPDITFHIYGAENETDNKNVVYHGWVKEEKMDKETRKFQGCIKGGSGGISITLIKSIMMGQYPISFNKIKGIWHAPDDESFIKQLNKLKDQYSPNLKLRKQYLNHFKHYGD